MDTIELLSDFGLTKIEATLYTALVNSGESNGYELAKLTGISRSNVYNSLSALCDKGAAYMIEGSSTLYVAVPPEEFCANNIKHLEKSAHLLNAVLKTRLEEPAGYITIKGHAHILDKIQNIINHCRERIYISAPIEIINEIMPDLKGLIARGMKVVVITSSSLSLEGAIVYHSHERNPQLRLISDTSFVLTGDSASTAEATCLYSQKKNLIELIKDTIKNEMLLIDMAITTPGKDELQ